MCNMFVTALEPEVLRDAVGVGESWVVWYGHKKKSSAETLRLLVLNTPHVFRRHDLHGPPRKFMGADAASPTAGRLTGTLA